MMPRTRQLCVMCDQPTECCEEDALYLQRYDEIIGPLCIECYDNYEDETLNLEKIELAKKINQTFNRYSEMNNIKASCRDLDYVLITVDGKAITLSSKKFLKMFDHVIQMDKNDLTELLKELDK